MLSPIEKFLVDLSRWQVQVGAKARGVLMSLSTYSSILDERSSAIELWDGGIVSIGGLLINIIPSLEYLEYQFI